LKLQNNRIHKTRIAPSHCTRFEIVCATAHHKNGIYRIFISGGFHPFTAVALFCVWPEWHDVGHVGVFPRRDLTTEETKLYIRPKHRRL
jgi:hypothetical protein